MTVINFSRISYSPDCQLYLEDYRQKQFQKSVFGNLKTCFRFLQEFTLKYDIFIFETKLFVHVILPLQSTNQCD